MRNNRAYIVVLLFVAWSLFSWHWYTCWIKGFCSVQQEAQQNVAAEPAEEIVSDMASVERKEKSAQDCSTYLTGYIRQGHDNDMSNVRHLEEFLNKYEGERLSVNGLYEDNDEQAVNRFQEKYRTDVLDPWDIAVPTGYVYKTTREHINRLYCDYTTK